METNSGIFFSFREREIFLLWINMDLDVIWWSFREREIDSYCNFVTLIKILYKVFWKFSLIHVKCKTIYVRDRIQIVSSIDASSLFLFRTKIKLELDVFMIEKRRLYLLQKRKIILKRIKVKIDPLIKFSNILNAFRQCAR